MDKSVTAKAFSERMLSKLLLASFDLGGGYVSTTLQIDIATGIRPDEARSYSGGGRFGSARWYPCESREQSPKKLCEPHLMILHV